VAHRAGEPGHGEDEAGDDERSARHIDPVARRAGRLGTPARISTAIGTLTAKM
jgi:hypothetical protein